MSQSDDRSDYMTGDAAELIVWTRGATEWANLADVLADRTAGMTPLEDELANPAPNTIPRPDRTMPADWPSSQ